MAHLGFEVGADPDHAPLHGHLKGEADDAADFQQGLLAQAPSTLSPINTPMIQRTGNVGVVRRGAADRQGPT